MNMSTLSARCKCGKRIATLVQGQGWRSADQADGSNAHTEYAPHALLAQGDGVEIVSMVQWEATRQLKRHLLFLRTA